MEMRQNEREKRKGILIRRQGKYMWCMYIERENSNESNVFSDEREIETRRLFTRRCNKVDTARTKLYIYYCCSFSRVIESGNILKAPIFPFLTR